MPPRALISWQAEHAARPKKSASPAARSPGTGAPAPAAAAPCRLWMKVTSCQACCSLRPGNGGIWVPGTPLRMTRKMSASLSPCLSPPRFKTAPPRSRSPWPSEPWQIWQVTLKSRRPSSAAAGFSGQRVGGRIRHDNLLGPQPAGRRSREEHDEDSGCLSHENEIQGFYPRGEDEVTEIVEPSTRLPRRSGSSPPRAGSLSNPRCARRLVPPGLPRSAGRRRPRTNCGRAEFPVGFS